MSQSLSNVAAPARASIHRTILILIGLLPLVLFMVFYNLGNNPRPWHDEGTYLDLARTLAVDGVYAVRNSDGYQTFGAVQSVGPTVIVPIALSFKLFGVGIVQGRAVTAIFALLVLAIVYACGRELFGVRGALVAVMLVVSAAGVGFLHNGRQALGEMPAVGFFLAGWLIWSRALPSNQHKLYPIAGLLLGMAMVTKSQYVPIGFVTLASLIVLDRFYYHQNSVRSLIIMGLIAASCVAGWLGWQIAYYGIDVFQQNANKLRQLASSTMGLDLGVSAQAFKYLFGPGSDHFHYFWGIPALAYVAILSIRRSQNSLSLAFLLLFSTIWLGYFTFWIIPWPQNALPPMLISCLFVAKLWNDLTDGFSLSLRALWAELRQAKPGSVTIKAAVLVSMSLVICYPLQAALRTDVLAHDQAPQQVALFLNTTIDKNTVIETWEHELAILANNHTYHFPDPAFLIPTQANYRGGSQSNLLSADYFQRYHPAYLVIGWFARANHIYDPHFLASNSCLLASFGEGERSYNIYRLRPSQASQPGTALETPPDCS